MFRECEYTVAQLQSGDTVAMQLEKDSRGNLLTHLIRVQRSSREWVRN